MNLNLLVDHNQAAFLAHCSQFVQEVEYNSINLAGERVTGTGQVVAGGQDHLHIFLADLGEEDVCAGLYRAEYPGRTGQQQPGKVGSGIVVTYRRVDVGLGFK